MIKQINTSNGFFKHLNREQNERSYFRVCIHCKPGVNKDMWARLCLLSSLYSLQQEASILNREISFLYSSKTVLHSKPLAIKELFYVLCVVAIRNPMKSSGNVYKVVWVSDASLYTRYSSQNIHNLSSRHNSQAYNHVFFLQLYAIIVKRNSQGFSQYSNIQNSISEQHIFCFALFFPSGN